MRNGGWAKHLKRVVLAAAVTAMLSLFMASTASATTVEVGGVKKTESIPLTMSLMSGTSTGTRDTFGFSQNTCVISELAGTTQSPYTGASVTAAVKTLSFQTCERERFIVHKPGMLHFSHITGTTNATVTSSGAEWTTDGPFGVLNCVTGAGTHLGTLTGSAAGHASLSINFVLSCSGVSLRSTGTYTVTSPTGFGLVA